MNVKKNLAHSYMNHPSDIAVVVFITVALIGCQKIVKIWEPFSL